MTLSNGSKSSESGLPSAHARRTSTGMTKSAIWIEEPTATPMDRSSLSLYETGEMVLLADISSLCYASCLRLTCNGGDVLPRL